MKEEEAQVHAALSSLAFQDHTLTWGGRKVTEIAQDLGQTPFYAYDKQLMRQRVAELRDAMPEQLQIHYAMKANPHPDVVNHMSTLVDGLDVASVGELQVALASGVSADDISIAGPGKRDIELLAAIESGITINVESYGELRRAANIAATAGKRPRVCVRVNPSFELKTAGMKMGGRPSPFGVDAEKVPEILDSIRSLDFDFRGFHVFSGSQNLRPDAISESLSSTVQLVIELAAKSAMPVPVVNLGGGLGIPYFPKEKPLPLRKLSEPFQQAVDHLHKELGPTSVMIELGRYLVGEAGIYVCQVIDVKESRGMLFAVCDGGLHHHLAASGNFGQVLRKNYPVVNVRRKKHSRCTTVVGPLCTPLDLLADRADIADVETGDLIAILQSGAYGRSASPSRFLSHPDCLEILL